jgi:hypothetical protein
LSVASSFCIVKSTNPSQRESGQLASFRKKANRANLNRIQLPKFVKSRKKPECGSGQKSKLASFAKLALFRKT